MYQPRLRKSIIEQDLLTLCNNNDLAGVSLDWRSVAVRFRTPA